MGRGNRFYLHLLVPGYNITNESHYEVVVSRIFLAFFLAESFGLKIPESPKLNELNVPIKKSDLTA